MKWPYLSMQATTAVYCLATLATSVHLSSVQDDSSSYLNTESIYTFASLRGVIAASSVTPGLLLVQYTTIAVSMCWKPFFLRCRSLVAVATIALPLDAVLVLQASTAISGYEHAMRLWEDDDYSGAPPQAQLLP